MEVGGEALWVPLDTGARSVWVDREWFEGHGGVWEADCSHAVTADGRDMDVCGKGKLNFKLWGQPFMETVRVASCLPSNLLLGSQFWKRHDLVLNLGTMRGKIGVEGRKLEGRVSRRRDVRLDMETAGAINDTDVDDTIREMDLSQFHPKAAMQERLRHILWTRRGVFKGLGHIRGVEHTIKLVADAKPACSPVRRRSVKEEELERTAMQKLLRMGVVEHASSPWAACIVFVRKKDGSTRVTSDFRGLNAVTVGDSYPMEDVQSTLDWMGSKSIFSTFDLKDGFFQVSLAEGSRDYTAIRTVIGLLRYVRLPQGLKNSPAVFQRVVNAILGSRKGRDVWAFMDDISMGTQTAEAHLLCLESVLDTFIAAGARLCSAKCLSGRNQDLTVQQQHQQQQQKPTIVADGTALRSVRFSLSL